MIKMHHLVPQHFDGNSLPNSKRTKIDENGCEKREVEVLYADGVWYRGWLSSYNFETGKWIVQFYDDDETTEVTFWIKRLGWLIKRNICQPYSYQPHGHKIKSDR